MVRTIFNRPIKMEVKMTKSVLHQEAAPNPDYLKNQRQLPVKILNKKNLKSFGL